jgi:hypothetical protein
MDPWPGICSVSPRFFLVALGLASDVAGVERLFFRFEVGRILATVNSDKAAGGFPASTRFLPA